MSEVGKRRIERRKELEKKFGDQWKEISNYVLLLFPTYRTFQEYTGLSFCVYSRIRTTGRIHRKTVKYLVTLENFPLTKEKMCPEVTNWSRIIPVKPQEKPTATLEVQL